MGVFCCKTAGFLQVASYMYMFHFLLKHVFNYSISVLYFFMGLSLQESFILTVSYTADFI